jgi:hypothetical protein
LKASLAAAKISGVIPGTASKAAVPSEKAARSFDPEEAGRPAAMAAAGTVTAALLL